MKTSDEKSPSGLPAPLLSTSLLSVSDAELAAFRALQVVATKRWLDQVSTFRRAS